MDAADLPDYLVHKPNFRVAAYLPFAFRQLPWALNGASFPDEIPDQRLCTRFLSELLTDSFDRRVDKLQLALEFVNDVERFSGFRLKVRQGLLFLSLREGCIKPLSKLHELRSEFATSADVATDGFPSRLVGYQKTLLMGLIAAIKSAMKWRIRRDSVRADDIRELSVSYLKSGTEAWPILDLLHSLEPQIVRASSKDVSIEVALKCTCHGYLGQNGRNL
ncbi:hypothetical protein CEG14_14910 [Bordetella genomosp. 1]|uniref:Uncharacterized protein n=1 Tax=Bordetella genomosp. 1 TaxID=1395607 RepID=A0A261SHN5_9BORD|nr:hypothetical protein CEG14_14910 [Bordetella genomosp. 1]